MCGSSEAQVLQKAFGGPQGRWGGRRPRAESSLLSPGTVVQVLCEGHSTGPLIFPVIMGPLMSKEKN